MREVAEVPGRAPGSITRAILVTDLMMLAITILVALVAGWGAGGPLIEDRSRLVLTVMILAIWPLTLWQRQSRASTVLGSGSEEYRRVIEASASMALLVAASAYFFHTTWARGYVVGVTLLGTGLLLLGRWIMRGSLQRTLNAGHPLHRVFIVASISQVRTVGEELNHSGNRFVAVGQWTTFGTEPDPEAVVRRACEAGADTIVYLPNADADPTWTRRLGWAMEDSNLSLMVSPSVVEVAGPRLRVEQIEGMALLSVEMPTFSGPARVVKRGVDLAGSIVGLVVLLVPMLVIALTVKLDSKGPVLYRQRRMGRAGTEFTCLKFRTMYVGADQQLEHLRRETEQSGATFKLRRDPRVTRVGAFLRRTSMDELPQLWNVLINDMSLVGPRPHQLADVSRYDRAASRRLLAKPGMTGLWQVSGRSDTTWDNNVMLDLYYVENWSLSLDIVIMLRTVKVVVDGSGAY